MQSQNLANFTRCYSNSMKIFILIFAVLLFLKHGSAQYKPVDNKSDIHFKIKTFGINVNGVFTGLEGNIFFDPNRLSDAKFDVSLDANTINTDNSLRDDHLREEAFFNVKNYPRIHFVSTKIIPSSKKGALLVYGKLSIKNREKDISFPFTAEELINGYFFKGTFIINRKDFGVGETNIISENVEISLSVFAEKKFNP
jgi:polyisoprenoid-binding protein YceI